LGETTEVIVRPRVWDLRASPGAAGHRRARAHHRNVVPVAAIAHDEFLALREYAVGDDLRRVHWRSSARLGELMMREDESAWRPQTVVIFDNRVGSYPGPSYETAVEALASIGTRLLQSTRSCEILTTSGAALGAANPGGLSSESRLLDELAMLTLDPDRPLAATVMALRSDSRRGRIIVITGMPADLAALVSLGGPSAPVTVVGCAPTLPTSTGAMTLIDGRPGALVDAWNSATVRVSSIRRRGGRA
jgi:uncharacterized protein (DUF58 family)